MIIGVKPYQSKDEIKLYLKDIINNLKKIGHTENPINNSN